MTNFFTRLFILLISFATCTNSVHLLGRKHQHEDIRAESDAMSSKKEVQDYMGWVERVKAKYELSASEASVRIPDDLPDDKVFSTLKMRVERVITVNKIAGLANFQTVKGAIDSVPKNNVQRTVIQIAAGVYR